MTVKMMTGKQVNFLQKLLKEKVLPKEEWAKIAQELNIETEADLNHLNVEQASKLIGVLIKRPNK